MCLISLRNLRMGTAEVRHTRHLPKATCVVDILIGNVFYYFPSKCFLRWSYQSQEERMNKDFASTGDDLRLELLIYIFSWDTISTKYSGLHKNRK